MNWNNLFKSAFLCIICFSIEGEFWEDFKNYQERVWVIWCKEMPGLQRNYHLVSGEHAQVSDQV